LCYSANDHFMKKNKTVKPKNQRSKNADPVPKSEEISNPAPAVNDESKFDFGGLPQRDLKKNLGCG
jgi:hypothetical protein